MQSVEGSIEAGEANAAAKSILGVTGAAVLPGMSVGLSAGVMLCLLADLSLQIIKKFTEYSFPTVAGPLLVALLIFAGIVPWLGRQSVRRFRSAMEERGLPLTIQTKISINSEEIDYCCGGSRTTSKWSGVTDLLLSKDYWFFMAQMSPIVVPKRFFLSTEAEREFISAALSLMSEAARQRSRAALEFAAAATSLAPLTPP